MRNFMRQFLAAATIMFAAVNGFASSFNAHGLKFFTTESEHFRIHYHAGIEHCIPRVAAQCEKLYHIYSDLFNIVLPAKTDFVVLDGDISNGWAFANTNTITIWTHDFDFNLRGSHDWFEDVITHEYAHIVSIQTGLKLPAAIPEIRIGYFSHPNEKSRTEAFQSIASDILPHWFTEGIAQYASLKYGADSWDTHRDMILRTLSLSGQLISWDNMQVFSGRGDDFEKTYNHGFSMVKYIVEKYGYEKINALLRESNKVLRMDFDGAIKSVFGITGPQFYQEWKEHLYKEYKTNLSGIGKQVYGKRISKDGYENFWPRFSPDDKKIYFISNGKNDYGLKMLYSASLSDTVAETDRIKPIAPIRSFYDLHPASGRYCFVSGHSKKSLLPPALGGAITTDLFTDTIPPEKQKFRLFPKKTEKQVTVKQSIFSAAFSPDAKNLACAKRVADHFFLAIADSDGTTFKTVYPPADKPQQRIEFIYSVDWSPSGNKIAFSYFDRHDRKIGLYDTSSKTCETVCNTTADERDPYFSPDGKHLYFSSDRTGIFNIYRYEFSTRKLERITNVSGGAFAPSVNSTGRKLVYAGYAADGYAIYCIDSIKAISDTIIPDAVTMRTDLPAQRYTIPLQPQRDYSFVPRQFLFVPTILTEQTVSRSDNVNKGVSALKTGFILNLIEPMTLSDLGNEIGGYFFLQPEHLLSFVNLHHKGINIKSNYDFGLYGVTHRLPLTVSAELLVRGIAGVDWFFNETEGEMNELPYRLDLSQANLQVSHFIDGEYSSGSVPKSQLAVHAFAGLNRYDVNLLLSAYGIPAIFPYNLSKGYRAGAMGTFAASVVEPDRYIAPKGVVAKVQYEFWNQYSLKQENSFDQSTLDEQYDRYLFHQITGHAKMGLALPWSKRHALHTDLQGRYLQILDKDTVFPSYYLPGSWIPGYAYYYRDSRIVQTAANDSSVQSFDTLTITGRAVFNGELSYRFPLSAKFVDKKFWFVYLERCYGAVNVNFGAGWDDPLDVFALDRNDYLFAYGLEARFEAITFNTYPLAIKLRWDYGADKAVPIGGNRFTFSIGYDFDNWGMVLAPDYAAKGLSLKGL